MYTVKSIKIKNNFDRNVQYVPHAIPQNNAFIEQTIMISYRNTSTYTNHANYFEFCNASVNTLFVILILMVCTVNIHLISTSTRTNVNVDHFKRMIIKSFQRSPNATTAKYAMPPYAWARLLLSH